MDANTIKRQIMSNNFTSEEINSFVDAIKFARSNLAKATARELSVGAQVNFKDRSGNRHQGTVLNIKIKNALVDIVGMGRYNVPMGMLEVI
jgi:hypothetical protein